MSEQTNVQTESPTNDHYAIRLDDVWVQFRLRHAHHFNLKRTLTNTITRRSDDAEIITALQSISLDIPKGSRLGLVGPNGSGKSTLLSVMAGALTPSKGTAHTNGRVLALLGGPNEGLDPEQTGRENARNLGIRLGESSGTMTEKLEDIREFSGLGRRFDHPVYSYSRGMRVRLRFTTITSFHADVLLMDEGIGAADLEFSDRAATRMQNFLSRSGTLVLSSHSQSLLETFCNDFIHLEGGREA
jgi:ABC-type polysaccharide/polyol phosphate transport system ATPase subunit